MKRRNVMGPAQKNSIGATQTKVENTKKNKKTKAGHREEARGESTRLRTGCASLVLANHAPSL
eukprot:73212-Pleurochrysis_carterae.AAC.2